MYDFVLYDQSIRSETTYGIIESVKYSDTALCCQTDDVNRNAKKGGSHY